MKITISHYNSTPDKIWLERLLNVERKELPAIVGGILMFFLLFTAYAVLRPVRETMGIAGGIGNLQWLFTVTFVVAIVMQIGFGWLVSKVSRRLILPWVYGFFVVNLLTFVIVMSIAPNNPWSAGTFYVWLSVFNLLAISLAWSLLTDIMNPDQSKRLFALVASGSSAGSILGPILTASLVNIVGATGLMLISAVMLSISALIGINLHSWRDRNPLPEKPNDLEARRKPIGGSPFSGVLTTFKSPYLLGIAIFVILASSTNTFLYFELMRTVSIDYPDRTLQIQIFSAIDLFVNACTIALQIFVTGRIAARLGLGILLVAVPISIALGFLWLAFMPLFAVIALIMIIRRIGQYAMVRPGREMLYAVLTPDEKYKSKNFIDTVLYRGGDMISAWLKSGLDMFGGGYTSLAMMGGFVLASAWAVVGLGLSNTQGKKAKIEGRLKEKEATLKESYPEKLAI